MVLLFYRHRAKLYWTPQVPHNQSLGATSPIGHQLGPLERELCVYTANNLSTNQEMTGILKSAWSSNLPRPWMSRRRCSRSIANGSQWTWKETTHNMQPSKMERW